MTWTTRALAGLVALLLVAGALAAVLGPGRSLRRDIASQRADVDAQRTMLGELVALSRTQQRLLAEGIGLQRDMLRQIASGRAGERRLLDTLRELLVLTRRILVEMRELNARTGGAVAG